MKERIIFHIDVNNAFLSWTAVKLLEEGYDVDIRTIPSVIAGDESTRHGIVLAKSPIAKKYGITTAETTYSARRKCKDLKSFPADMKYYKKKSKELMEYLSQFTPQMEQFSVDECFLDMSHSSFLYHDLIALAYTIKDYVKTHFKYTVNIGIANNKLCAKMASDFEKPDRVHTLFKEEIPKKMWPLPVGDLFMIGKKTQIKLQEMGITTIGDLAHSDVSMLSKVFKSQGVIMWEYANGVDESKVEMTQAKNKCISVSETLPKDVDEIEKLEKILFRQAERIGRELRRQEFYATTLAVTLKTNEFKSYSKQKKMPNASNLSEDIYKVACQVLEECYMGDAIRNIGIRTTDFTSSRNIQISLFEQEPKEKEDEIQKTVDSINDKFGDNVIMKAALFSKKEKNKEKEK